MPYHDLREYLQVLEAAGKLKRITAQVDKDWEIAAVCRRVFQRIPPRERPALCFEQVKGYTIPFVAGVLGGSRQIYALALGVEPEHIWQRWESGLAHPIKPIQVDGGPCKERILRGSEVDLYRFPHATWTVGEDPGPYITSGFVVSVDPDSGVRNVGTYRLQVKEKGKLGIFIGRDQHMCVHVRRNEQLGRPTPVAVVIGADPVVGLCSVAKFPYGVDELAVVGGLRGLPLEVVPCETVPLQVPATAEIVIEGEIPPGVRETEGPFGEYTGYMGVAGESWVIQVACITQRADPIYQGFVSQMPPSESSMIKAIGREQPLLHHLRDTLGLPVTDVCFTESSGSTGTIIIAMRPRYRGQGQEVIWATWGYVGGRGKITIVVDDDVEVHDPFQVEWALNFHMQPGRDVMLVSDCPAMGLDPSTAPADVPQHHPQRSRGTKMGIDATRKHRYPPPALPPQEHLQRVDANWARYGL